MIQSAQPFGHYLRLPADMSGRRLFDPLYNGENISSIKFYGHSLGTADYSYFQAIFDQIDLYGGNTTLYFLHAPSYPIDPETVSQLINRYASGLIPESHGRNLLHKLLLEDRLKIAEIQPEP